MLHLLKRRQRTVILTMLILTLIWLLIFGAQLFQAVRGLLDAPPPSGDDSWLRQALDVYGLPLVFVAVLIAAAGVPLPVSWLLLAVGAAAGQGEYSVAWVVGIALVAAVLGDHLGYLIGWSGGRWLVHRIARLLQSEDRLPGAQGALRRRGWLAIFLSRWLLLPLCGPVNWLCGSVRYPLARFFVADVLGEGLYVALCVFLGVAFSDQIEAVARLVGNLGLWLVGLLLALLLIWRLLRRSSDAGEPAQQPVQAA